MIRLWLGAGLAIALTAAGFFGYRSAFLAGHEAGAAVVRAQWEADKAQALQASYMAFAAEVNRREEVERELQGKLDAADVRGRTLAGRLQSALAQARSCLLPAVVKPASAVDDASPKPDDASQIGAAFADHLAACERDAEQLTQLQRWVSGAKAPPHGAPDT